jgi:hypothetical protein
MSAYPLYSTARPSNQVRRSYFSFLHSVWQNQAWRVKADSNEGIEIKFRRSSGLSAVVQK